MPQVRQSDRLRHLLDHVINCYVPLPQASWLASCHSVEDAVGALQGNVSSTNGSVFYALRCRLTPGQEEPDYYEVLWTKDGRVVQDSEDIYSIGNTLFVFDGSVGNYSCRFMEMSSTSSPTTKSDKKNPKKRDSTRTLWPLLGIFAQIAVLIAVIYYCDRKSKRRGEDDFHDSSEEDASGDRERERGTEDPEAGETRAQRNWRLAVGKLLIQKMEEEQGQWRQQRKLSGQQQQEAQQHQQQGTSWA